MRNLCLVLLLVNVLAFAYQRWIIQPDNPVAATHIEQDYPRLTAVQLGPRPAPQQERVAISADNGAKCIKIGPIPQKSAADSLVATLGGRDLQASLEAAEGSIWVGHWVQVVALADRAAAESARERLKAAGLSDAYIVSGGDELKISLGVFKSTPSADQTIRRARDLGFVTRMDERYQPGTQYWLTVVLPDGREFRPGELRSDTGQILRTEAVACPASG